LVPLPVEGPFDRVATDIVGPVPLTPSGNKYIIVFSDYLTKFIITAALPNTTAENVAKVLIEKLILQHGAH